MDYMQFVDYHRTSGADITIGCIAYDKSRASDFGLMKVRSCCVCVLCTDGLACLSCCIMSGMAEVMCCVGQPPHESAAGLRRGFSLI
jgi:hypothetical protein